MNTIEIGKIVTAVGIKGEVKVYSYSANPMRLADLKELYIGEELEVYHVEKVRSPKPDTAVVKLAEVKDRNQAEALRGKSCYICEDDLEELPDGEFYIKDIIGLEVFDAGSGDKTGYLFDIIQNTAQDIYVIKDDCGKEILVPAVSEFIKEINPDAGYIRINFIDGMK